MSGSAGRDWVRPVLIRLGVALTRRRSYGPSHPMVVEAEQALVTALQQGLSAGSALAIGVAHRQLVVDGVPFEHGGLIAEDLAERLHRRGVGALTIQRGVALEGLQALLAWLSLREGTESVPPSIPAVIIGRVAYDRLTLADDVAVQAEIDAVWQALAVAALDDTVDAAFGTAYPPTDAPHTEPPGATDRSGGHGPAHTPELVADAIRARAGQRPYAERLGVNLGSLAARLAEAPPGVRDVIAGLLQQVIARLDASTIATIVTSVGDQRAQRHLVTSVVDVLPLSAVVNWLDVASRASGQELSHHLLRILSKLATHAGRSDGPSDGRSDGRGWSPDGFRAATRHLVQDWELGDPNPGEHASLLDHIARLNLPARPAPQRDATDTRAMTEADLAGNVAEGMRLIQMACELGVAGDDALACVDTLMTAGLARELVTCLEQAPESDGTRALRARLLSPTGLNAALRSEPFDAEAARRLLAATSSVLAPALLDALEAVTVRKARRLIYDRLRSEGAALLPIVYQRLGGTPPWYFARNLLALLRDIGDQADGAPTGLDREATLQLITAYQSHAREQVRLEALRVLVQMPGCRDAAISRALRDDSLRVVSTAIDALLAEVSGEPHGRTPHGPPAREAHARERARALAGGLMALANAPHCDEATRVSAIRALAVTPAPAVRTWLLQLVSHRSRLLRRVRIAASRPAVEAALDLLAGQYADEPDVQQILRRANRLGSRATPSSASSVPWPAASGEPR